MGIHDSARRIRRRWRGIAIAAAVGLVVALSISLAQQPVYQSTARLFVSTQQSSTTSDPAQADATGAQTVQSYASIATAPIVLDAVIRQLDLNMSAAALASEVTAKQLVNTDVLEISVADRSAAVAADIANAISSSLAQVASRVSPTGSQVSISSVKAASVSTTPATSQTGLDAALGALVGILAALTFALVRGGPGTAVRGARDMRDAF